MCSPACSSIDVPIAAPMLGHICIRSFALLAAALIAAASFSRAVHAEGKVEPLQAVPSLDVSRYMGLWYEISKYPNRFQKHCVGDTTATYELRPDATVGVTNRCRTDEGEIDEAIGVARQIGGPESAKLEVRFAPGWLGFLPFVWGDYWVVDLDADYQLVAVSEPSREYLWILSRTPKVETAKRSELLDRLAAMGFDTARLEATPQSAAAAAQD